MHKGDLLGEHGTPFNIITIRIFPRVFYYFRAGGRLPLLLAEGGSVSIMP